MSNNTVDHLLQNKESWNSRVPIHLSSKFYNVDSFKEGRTSLSPIEIEGLGDVNQKSLLHLQCHFGQDSLSLARQGAIVTGVDFSEKAIESAQSIAGEMNVSAKFLVNKYFKNSKI